MQQLKPGQRWRSVVCEGEVMVIRAPALAGELRCGGAPMAVAGGTRVELDPAWADPIQVGKRYIDADDSLELLCIRGGRGALAWNGARLGVKVAKALPSSD